MESIANNENIEIVPLQSYPKFFQVGPQLVQYLLKAIFLTLTLLLALVRQAELPKFVLVQVLVSHQIIKH
jgi:hypothetical protein